MALAARAALAVQTVLAAHPVLHQLVACRECVDLALPMCMQEAPSEQAMPSPKIRMKGPVATIWTTTTTAIELRLTQPDLRMPTRALLPMSLAAQALSQALILLPLLQPPAPLLPLMQYHDGWRGAQRAPPLPRLLLKEFAPQLAHMLQSGSSRQSLTATQMRRWTHC